MLQQEPNSKEQKILQAASPLKLENEPSFTSPQNISELEKISMIKSTVVDIIQNLPSFEPKEENDFDKKPLTFLQRKILKYQQETQNSFGSLGELKKTYSRIEREQMKIKENLELDKEYELKRRNLVMIQNRLEKYYGINENKQYNLDDCFINKKEELFLGKKRKEENDENVQDRINRTGYTPIKKKKVEENYEDFGTFMSKAIKNKPLIQIQKEKFIEEQNEKRKAYLQKKNSRGDVLKCDLNF